MQTNTKLLAGPPLQAGQQGTILSAASLANQPSFRIPKIQRPFTASNDGQAISPESDAIETHTLCRSEAKSWQRGVTLSRWRPVLRAAAKMMRITQNRELSV